MSMVFIEEKKDQNSCWLPSEAVRKPKQTIAQDLPVLEEIQIRQEYQGYLQDESGTNNAIHLLMQRNHNHVLMNQSRDEEYQHRCESGRETTAPTWDVDMPHYPLVNG